MIDTKRVCMRLFLRFCARKNLSLALAISVLVAVAVSLIRQGHDAVRQGLVSPYFQLPAAILTNFDSLEKLCILVRANAQLQTAQTLCQLRLHDFSLSDQHVILLPPPANLDSNEIASAQLKDLDGRENFLEPPAGVRKSGSRFLESMNREIRALHSETYRQ